MGIPDPSVRFFTQGGFRKGRRAPPGDLGEPIFQQVSFSTIFLFAKR